MHKLTMKTKLGFGVGDLGGNMFFTLVGFYLLFYFTDIIKLPAIRQPEHKEKYEGTGFLRTYVDTLGLKVFLLAVIPWTLFIAGTSVVQGSLIY